MNKLSSLGQLVALSKPGSLKGLVKAGALQQNSVRTAYVITRDWIPGKRPETEEDRLKAAKKYNLLPEEYKPQPDDGFAQGDYPDVPGSHHDARDPFYPWDYPFYRHNYGDPFPDKWNISLSVHYNYENDFDKHYSPLNQIVTATVVLGGVGLVLYYFGIKWKHYEPHYEPAMYKKGVTHYGYH